MADFVLINLGAQRAAVQHYTQGWTPEAILRWMERYGRVQFYEGLDAYSFSSHTAPDIHTAFRFDDQGKLIVIR